ncbi:MAG TPA: hypothetical protein VHZ55_24310 [Bryobacteraceae bacterium]|nr:hypothetical protein [Bryobacteraceae bacterium]
MTTPHQLRRPCCCNQLAEAGSGPFGNSPTHHEFLECGIARWIALDLGDRFIEIVFDTHIYTARNETVPVCDSIVCMVGTSYNGLAEFGLPLITKDDCSFHTLMNDIEGHLGPRLARPAVVSDRAAVLLNNTGRAITAVEWFWRYGSHDGKVRTSRFSNLGSSAQRDVLVGRSKVGRDIGTFILPGSKRLITERGIFGNNLDVLTPEELPRAQGYCGGWSGGSSCESEAELAAVELVLDLVILEDGLCIGPDESALYEVLNESLDLQRMAAAEALTALQAGASVGQIFEIVRPLARHGPPPPETHGKARHLGPIVQTFANEAIHHLINATDSDLLAFFERAAEPRSFELRRPR